jgi:ABC-type Zn uptake system ZnuABC Zn-binding protein ZnuA
VRIRTPRPTGALSRTPAPAASMALIALLAAAVTACGGSGASSGTTASGGAGGSKLTVLATTTQVADFARNIGGDKIAVTQVLRPNVDAHDYEASPADIQAIAQADLVIKNGVGLEAFLDGAIKSAGFDGTVVDASKGVTLRHAEEEAHEGEEAHEEGDPHIWHNPQNAVIMSRNIAAALAAKAPADKATFDRNLQIYTGKIQQLDTWIAQQIDSIPADRRKLVTNHDAFGYYIDRYKLTFVGSIIPSFDTSAELSARSLNDLVAKIRSAGVRAIFSESSLPPKTAQTVGAQAGVKVVAGEGSLYGDSLGAPGSTGGTYLDMERHNTTTIVNALKG